MEQHKVLLIIVSVTLFFAAVLGVGLWLFYPHSGAGQPVAAGNAPLASATGSGGQADKEARSSFDPIEYLRQGEKKPTLQPSSRNKDTGNVIIVYGDGQSTGGPTSSGTSAGSPGTTGSVGAATGSLGALSPTPHASAAAPSAVRPSVPKTTAAAPAKPSPTAKPAAAPRPKRVESTRKHVAVKKPAHTLGREYWVQLLSSIHRSTVEQAQTDLQQKYALPSLITAVTIGDTDYFRLRVGPYRSKQEAEKFRVWLKELKSYKGAYVSEVFTH